MLQQDSTILVSRFYHKSPLTQRVELIYSRNNREGDMDFYDLETELKKREYNLTCKVVRKRVAFLDDAYDGNSQADVVILEPYEGTERDMFMRAWYNSAAPVPNGEGHLVSKVELPMFVASPISMPAMVRLSWPNEIYDKPHLFVMTVAIEQLFNTYKNLEKIDIKIFPVEKADELNVWNGHMRV
jgi:hypothetical protein